MFPRSYLLSLMPENYFTERETVAGGSITFTTPLPYASAQLTRFVIDERLLIASNKAMAWVAVTAVTEHDDHMEYEADVLSGRPGTFDPRTTIISYGLPGEGYIIHQTNQGRSYVDVSRHEGKPWVESEITNILRMGWLGGVGLEAPTANWLGPMSSSGALLNPSLEFESTEYGLAIGPNYAGGPWSVFSDIRHHSYRSSHNWATVNKETGGVDADASGNELAWWIGSKSEPCFWLTAEGVCGTTLLGDGNGGNTPSTLAFLLGPNTPRTSTQWKSAQGHVAELSGAFRLGQGPFPATQSLTVLADDDNLVENPVFENNVTDYWTGISNGTAAQVSTNPRWGTKCCKLTATGSSGLVFRKVTAVSSPSQDDRVTWSIYVRGAGDTLGKDVWLFVSEKGAANAFQSGDVVTMTSEWQRVAFTHQVSQTGVTGLNIKVMGPAGSAGDYFFVDGANLTETDYLVPHIDGEREGCAWSGTAHNSVSGVTTATVVDLDDDVDVINSHPQLSIGMWVQMPCASDQGSSELLLMDAYSAAAAMDRFKIYFRCAGAGHNWGVYCQGGERLTTSTSERIATGGFNAGDQVFVVLTIDFDESDAHFYMNGASYGTFSGALQRFAFTIWRLGANFNGREQRGLGIGEVSVYHRILTPTEVAEFSRQQQPMSSSTQDVQEGVTYGGGLVNVPRGTVYGGQDACANIISPGANYNTVIGHGAMYYNETGDGNCVYGYQAGYGATGQSYSESVLIGYQAGYSLTEDRHVFIGYQAGYGYNTEHWGNVCIGYKAGFTHGGSHAILIGYEAGINLTDVATENVVIGEWAANDATGIQNCVLIGGYAGSDLTGEYYNTFVGYAAGVKAGYGGGGTALYNTYIGASAGAGTGRDNVCVGVHAGEGFITTSTYSYSVIVGSEAGYSLTTGDSNVFMGYQAGKQATTAYEAVLIGYQAGFTLDSTGGNVCIGNLAGYNVGINDDCVYIGEHAGRNIDDGSANTAVGPSALEGADTSLVSGVANTTAIGYFTLSNIKTGYRNDAHGHCSQFSNEDGYDNVAVGYYSLYYNVTGINNVAVGASAGRGVTGQSFSNNTLIGHHAGFALSSGGSNVFLGYLAGSAETTGSNKLFIANSASTTPLVYGEFDNDILKIYGSLIVNEGGLAGYDVRFESDNNDKMFWLDASADTLQIGDPTGGNYSQFASDGLLTMTGTARVTVDLYIDAAGLKAPGAKPATYIQHGLAGAWQFADEAVAGNQQSISGKLPLPSQMDRAVVPIVRAGWSANGVSPGNCEWQLEYRYMSPNDDTTATAQETLTAIGTASSTTDGLTLTSFSGIDLPSSTDAAMFFKLTRLSAGTNDTIVDTTELHGMIFTHTIDKLGTAT